MVERYYFKLLEITGDNVFDAEWADASEGMYSMFRERIHNFPTAAMKPDNDITKQLYRYFWREACNRYIGYLDIEHSPWEPLTKLQVWMDGRWDDELAVLAENWFIDVWNIFENTKDYYYTIIGLYEAKKNDLLEAIKNEVRFNDTPQNAPTAGGGYETDEYTTTVTTSKTDGNTVIARLKEVENNLSSLYTEWVEKFTRTLCLEVNE